MPSDSVRLFVDPETGERFMVRLAPRELTGYKGVSAALNSAVFETEEGRWVGAVPVYSRVTLEELSEPVLAVLLRQARKRGL